MTDSLADFLTRIRNAIRANLRFVEIPASRMKENISKTLLDAGYIRAYTLLGEGTKRKIRLSLKYHPVTKMPAISYLKRVSKPGLRKYAGVDEIPRVLNGLGIAILSTPKGILTDKQAKKENVGGEVICYIY